MNHREKLAQDDSWVTGLQPGEGVIDKAGTSDAANQLPQQLEDCGGYIRKKAIAGTFCQYFRQKECTRLDQNPLGM